MGTEHYMTGVLIEESTTYSFSEVCHDYNISQQLLLELIEQGLLPNQPAEVKNRILTQRELRRVQSALRLHQDLGINPPGVTLVIELLEKIEEMNQELDILRKHF